MEWFLLAVLSLLCFVQEPGRAMMQTGPTRAARSTSTLICKGNLPALGPLVEENER